VTSIEKIKKVVLYPTSNGTGLYIGPRIPSYTTYATSDITGNFISLSVNKKESSKGLAFNVYQSTDEASSYIKHNPTADCCHNIFVARNGRENKFNRLKIF
jgi:hypothetical protein